MTLHITCAFQVIKLPMKELQHFLITFSYNFYISLKSVEKLITPQLEDPLSHAFYKYWQILICILVDLEWVYKSAVSKRSDNQWLLDLKRGGRTPPPPTPPWPDMLAEMAWPSES